MTTTQWDAQEADADRIVRDSVSRLTGADCGLETARALRGLTTNRYPKSASEIRVLADLLRRLCPAFLAAAPLDPPDHRAVKQDAAIKLWLLAALAARRAPVLAAKTAVAATRMTPTSLAPFVLKAARRVAHR